MSLTWLHDCALEAAYDGLDDMMDAVARRRETLQAQENLKAC